MALFSFRFPFGFSRRRGPAVGIDIGHREIKGVAVKKGRGGPQVTGVAGVDTPPGALENGGVGRIELLAGALGQVAGQLGIQGQRVVTAAPARHLIVRQMYLPPMPAEEVAEVAKIEAGRVLPVAGQDVVLDHVVTGEVQQEGQKQLEVLLVALPKSVAYAYYEVFATAGLRLIAIDAEPLALHRALFGLAPGEGTAETVMVANGGAGFTTVSIFTSSRLVFCRAIAAGGNTATEAVAAAFDVDFAAAQKIKEDDAEIIFGQVDVSTHDEKSLQLEVTIRSAIMETVREIARSLDFYQAQGQNAGRPVSRVYLTGGLARLKGIDKLLAEELGLPVQPVGPQLVYGPAEVPLDPVFTVAVGLALWGVLE